MARSVDFFSADISAVFDAAPDEGDGKLPSDPTANSNRPAIDPVNWLSYVRWHSDFFQFELVSATEDIEVSHAQVDGDTNVTRTFGNGYQIVLTGDEAVANHTLVTHSLGYVPEFMVAYEGVLLSSGTEVQPIDNGGRIVSAYATDAIIGLRELAHSSADDLPAVTRSYSVAIFRNPASNPALPLFSFDIASGKVIKGRGKLDTSKRYARRVQPFESGFDVNLGPTIQFGNGGVRVISGGNIHQSGSYYHADAFAGPSYIPIGGFL